MQDIFAKRVNIKPYEYPNLLDFKDSIRHSYWIHTEFNTTNDVQNFKVDIDERERAVITKTMLAISQIEVNVKRFWGNLYNHFPKPEIDDVGGTFAESEIRHKDAYSFLLEKLGLNAEFEKIYDIPAIIDRVNYLEKFMEKSPEGTAEGVVKQNFTLTLILFSLFVEHISLFGQFLIIMSFNKHKNLFKGISNIVEATSKEEEIHGRFGIELYRIIKEERPDIFTKEFENKLRILAGKALDAEVKILDWIYEDGDIEVAPKEEVKSYIINRFNKSLGILGVDMRFVLDESLLENTVWFDEEILSTKENDQFNKRSTAYSKKTKTITRHDLYQGK